jgi:hypothetical protein
MLNEEFNLSKEEIRKNLEHAIDLNQIYGECITDREYLEIIEKEINTENKTQQVIELIKNYNQKTKYTLCFHN